MKSIDEIGSLSNDFLTLDVCQRKQSIDVRIVRRPRTRLARPLLNDVILRIHQTLLDADSISKLRLNDQVQSISTLGSVESR